MIYQPSTHTFRGTAKEGFFTIALQLTRRCNYKCSHCSESEFIHQLDSADVYKIIDKLAEHKVQRVNVSGGEPTLRPDWEQLITHMADKGLTVSLATNCSQLDATTISRLKGKVANIRVSLYGPQDIHEAITLRSGSFEQVCNTAKLARNAGIPVYACMAIMKSNLLHADKVLKICKTLEMEKLLIYSLVPKGRGKDIYEKEGLTRTEAIKALGDVRDMPEVYWSPFDKDGICALIQADGSLVATPYFGNDERVQHVGFAHMENLDRLWEKYPFKENYLTFNSEKLKC